MARIDKYSKLIRDALTAYSSLLTKEPNPNYEVVLLFDDEHKQYMIRKIGWSDTKRIDYIPPHVALRDGKIWIEEDWTEEGIATYFLEHGVPNNDIVLGFQPPIMRSYTEFAVA
ncbi:XisI protein [Chloroflexi bacterium TSY]|nr:XisI protein [Chloroflexi bacterium TSY]